MTKTKPDPQDEVLRVAGSLEAGWLSARDLWADEGVREACGNEEITLLELILRMYRRNLLYAGVPGGVLSVWVKGKPPVGTEVVSFQPLAAQE